MASPLEQFTIKPLAELSVAGVDASFTNSSAFMLAALGCITLFMLLGMRRAELVPGRWQSMVELSYEMVANMLGEIVGPEARKFFPFVFSLFMFVLACNLLGMIPYSFTVTSHIVVTFALAAVVFVLVTVVGFIRHGFGYLRLFAPHGVPIPVLVILAPIEVVSYLVRPVSLSVRLFANMMAGHTMLKVFGGFVISLAAAGGVLTGVSIVPALVTVAFTGLEFLVAVLQAYIFTVLTCIYLNDAINLHH